jgi:ABC-type phosphate/phosphonate transport system ATPase subunit
VQQNGRIIGSPKGLRARIGVVFQQFNLVSRLSVLTNVCLGLLGRLPFLQGTSGTRNAAALDALRHQRQLGTNTETLQEEREWNWA